MARLTEDSFSGMRRLGSVGVERMTRNCRQEERTKKGGEAENQGEEAREFSAWLDGSRVQVCAGEMFTPNVERSVVHSGPL